LPERELRRAIELNPNYATAHQWLAEHLSPLKRTDEALAEIRRALELDPLSVIMNRIYGDILVDARRYDEAIAQYQKTLDLDPNFPTAHYFLGRAYEFKGMYDEAVAEYTKSQGISIMPAEAVQKLKEVYAKSGWKAYLKASIDMLMRDSFRAQLPPFVIATFHARLGDNDEAIQWLEKGYEERDFRMTLLSVSPEFDGLRSDPRFRELVRRMGLPE